MGRATYIYTCIICIYNIIVKNSKNRLQATHIAIIKNMKQDVLTWRSFCQLTLYPAIAIDKKTSGPDLLHIFNYCYVCCS